MRASNDNELPLIEVVIGKLQDAQDMGKKRITLSAREIDELLWVIGEQDLALGAQRHMIAMLEMPGAAN